jgi:uncharacterized protein HemX
LGTGEADYDHKMTKQQKQTRKRTSQASGASNAKQTRSQTREGEGSKSGINYFRLCSIVVVVLCASCAVFLLWKKPNFHSGAPHSTHQHREQKDETIKPSRKHSKRNQKGIKSEIFIFVM